MSATIRIGFIGCGAIAATHMKVIDKDPRGSIAGVFDASNERASATGRPVFASAAALLDAVDAVYITSPNRSHAQYALQAIEARKHVFCEKPMAVTREDVDAIAAASAASGRVFQVGHNKRFAPAYLVVKEALSGEPALGGDFKMNRGELENPPWTRDDQVTGGYLFETPIHIFDMARFLMGEVVELTARAESLVYPGTADTFFALFRFASHRTATFRSVAFTGWSFPYERVEIYGKHATWCTEEMEHVRVGRGLGTATETFDYRHIPWEERAGYAPETRAFLDAIERGQQARVTAADGAAAVKIALAIYESARTGGPVKL